MSRFVIGMTLLVLGIVIVEAHATGAWATLAPGAWNAQAFVTGVVGTLAGITIGKIGIAFLLLCWSLLD